MKMLTLDKFEEASEKVKVLLSIAALESVLEVLLNASNCFSSAARSSLRSCLFSLYSSKVSIPSRYACLILASLSSSLDN